MRKLNQFNVTLTAVLFCIIGAASCTNNATEVPFPAKNGFTVPESKPLVFSAPKPLLWDTIKKGPIKPVTKPLDINTLPSYVYDTVSAKPFMQAPVAKPFNIAVLPDTAFNIDALPSKPCNGRLTWTGMPELTVAGAPVVKNGTPLSIFELGVKQGLPAQVIAVMLKDRHGLTWLAGDGLYRYDGEHLQTFFPRRGPQPVVGMVEDNNGKLWCATNFGLMVIDVAKGTITYIEQFIFPANDLARLIKDNNGRIWALNSTMGGILVIDPETFTYKHISTGITDSRTYGVVKDSSNNIWVTTKYNGLSVFNLTTGRLTRINHRAGLASDTLSSVGVDGNGKIWVSVASNSATNGYDIIDTKQNTLTHLGQQQGISRNFCLSMLSGNNGDMWMGGFNSLNIINLQNKTVRSITTAQGLSNQSIVSLFKDDGNRIWAGASKGLNIIEQDGQMVKPLGNKAIVTLTEDGANNIWAGTYTGIRIIEPSTRVIRTLDKQHGLGHNFVQSFTEDGGKIWVTTNGGLDIIDRTQKTIQHLGAAEGLASDSIYGILKDKLNNLWLSGPTKGIGYVDLKNNIIKQAGIKQGLSDDAIADIKQDAEGNVWLGTVKGGVDVINLTDGTVKYLTNAPGLKDTCYRILLPDNAGRMWIGTDKGLYIADTKNNTLTELTTAEGLPANKIISLLEHDGKIYAASDKSVSIITPPNATGDTARNHWLIQPLDQSAGLVKEVPSSWSTNAIGKKGQYLWGDSGITIINTLAPNTAAPPPVYVTGVKIINEPGHFNNRLLLAAKDTMFTADTFYTANERPVLNHIAGINWDSVAGPYNMPVHLNIPYNANYLQFQFTQAHTGSNILPVYSYILEGIDKQWSTVTSNAFSENYLNLSPGDYTFKVRAKSMSSGWSQPASFSFTISPPWWKTWWAYTLYITCMAVGLLVFVRYRSRRLIAEKTELEEKVKERTIALEKSLEELKTTQKQLVQSEKMASLGELTAGIAHEIQNPLNFVNNFAEVSIELAEELKDELDKVAMDTGTRDNVDAIIDDLVQNQQKINFHGKRADSIVKGMLQHSRTGSGQKEPADINVLADEYLRLSYHGLRAKDKTFNARLETNFDESLPKISVLAQEIGRVLLNLYTNAFYSVMKKKKSGVENYQPVVSVSTRKTGDTVEIRVKDNGMGIPQNVLDKIFNPFFTTKPTGEGTGLGLSLSYEIVTKAHNGTIRAETKEGEFAEFIIQLPL